MKKYLLHIKLYIIISLSLSILEAVTTSLLLLFPGWLIDNFKNGLFYIIKLTLLYILTFTLYLIIAYCSNRISDYRRIKFEKAIKKDFFNAVISRDFNSFYEYDIAEYISIQANDITEMCQNYLSPLLSIYRSILLIISFGISLIIFVNGYIAAIVFLFSVIVVFVPNLTAKKLAFKNKSYLDKVGLYTSIVSKMLEAHDILDNRSGEKLKEIHNNKLNNVLSANMDFRKTNSLSLVINGGSVEFVSVITFIIVAILLLNGKITVGMATIAFTYSTKFMEPIHELNICIGKVHSVKKVQKKILNIINYKKDQPYKVLSPINKIQTSELTKKYTQTTLSFPQLEFEYPKKYLITGKNGVGKSVFLRLLMQFEKADIGTVKYDGCTDINVSENICYVPQIPIIFNSSYIDNITVFNTYDTKNIYLYESFFSKEILDNIKNNPTVNTLSSGEKQIISIIRALCSEKEIIIMDEPFSAMNKITIDYFMSNLKQINKMLLIVAHNVGEYKEIFDKEIVFLR